jgi:hypothetical protein
MKAFRYNGSLYIRCVPAKTLFHSTMVHEVVNRGDVFALEVGTQKLTIIPGTAQVEHCELGCIEQIIPQQEARVPSARTAPLDIAAKLGDFKEEVKRKNAKEKNRGR